MPIDADQTSPAQSMLTIGNLPVGRVALTSPRQPPTKFYMKTLLHFREQSNPGIKFILAMAAGLMALLSGCATNAQRAVPLPHKATSYTAQNAIKVSKVDVSITDGRSDHSLDPILSTRPADDATQAIREAILSSKLVQVEVGSTEVLSVNGSLVKLEWFVPGYQGLLKKAFFTSFLTGGIGGVAYGSTSTPVEGHAVLKVSVSRDGHEVLNRTYVGIWQEKTAKFSCDTLDTKTRVAGAALADAIDKMLKDIDTSTVLVEAPAVSAM